MTEPATEARNVEQARADLRMWHVVDEMSGDMWWAVASDEAGVRDALADFFDGDWNDLRFHPMDGSEVMKLTTDYDPHADGPDLPEGAVVERIDEGTWRMTATAAAVAATCDEPICIAGSEW